MAGGRTDPQSWLRPGGLRRCGPVLNERRQAKFTKTSAEDFLLVGVEVDGEGAEDVGGFGPEHVGTVGLG